MQKEIQWKNLFLGLTSFSFLFLASCAREALDSGPTSKVKVSLPQTITENKISSKGISAKNVQAMTTTLKLTHVSISGTGEGIPGSINANWDSCRNCDTKDSSPSSFQLVMPAGQKRLIQVLAVYQDSDTSEMSFYYKDVEKDLNSAEVGVPITVEKINSGTLVQGKVAGRYLTGTNSGPTGIIDIQYAPPGGKPAMSVDSTDIINGWFNVFMLYGVDFKYVVRGTGEVLWGGPVSLSSAAMAGSSQVVKAFVPVHILKKTDNSITNYYQEDAQVYVWGYWGTVASNVSSKTTCYKGITGTASFFRQYVATAANFGSSAPLNIVLGTAPAIADLTNKSAIMTDIKVAGGLSMATLCNGDDDTNLFVNFQKVQVSSFDGKSGDEFAGFENGFILDATNGTAISVATTGNVKNIKGNLLPGISNVVSGYRAYKSTGYGSNQRIDRPNCIEIAAGQTNFTPASSVTAIVSDTIDITTSISGAEIGSGVASVLCPVVGSNTTAWGGKFVETWLFGGGASGNGSMATSIEILAPFEASPSLVIPNVCTPIRIRGMKNGNPAMIPQNTILTFGSSDSTVEIHGTASCSSPIPNYTVSSYTSLLEIYVNATAAGPSSFTITATPSLASIASGSVTMTYQSITPLSHIVRAIFPADIFAFQCYPVVYQTLVISSIGETAIENQSVATVTLNDDSGKVDYFTDSDCNTPKISTLGLKDVNLQKIYYFRYIDPTPVATINLVPSTPACSSSTCTIPGPNNIILTHPLPPTSFDFNMPMTISKTATACQPIQVKLRNSLGLLSPPSSALASVTVASSDTTVGELGATDCTTAPSGSQTIGFAANTDVQKTLYFKPINQGTVILNASHVSPELNGTITITVVP